MQTEILRAEGLCKSYPSGKGKLKILKGLDLSVRKGETLSIIGKSGSGKSTLLLILSLLLSKDYGKLYYYGKEVGCMSEKEISRLKMEKIGYLFQSSLLMEDFTALENVMMPCLIANKNRKEAEEEARKLISSFHLEKRMNAFPNELSGGEKERFALIRGIIRHPDILFLDEPTGSLDEESRKDVIDSIFSLDGEVSIVLVTHDLELGRMAGRRLLLEKGVLCEI